MHDLAPVVVNLSQKDTQTLREALAAGRPIVLAARGAHACPPGVRPHLRALLRHPLPVTGVLEGRLEGPAAALMLACDNLVVTPRASLRFETSGLGEVALLALRLGYAEASRVWFSGGKLSGRQAATAGWAEVEPSGFGAALEAARTRYDGLSHEAITLLRPLLYHQAGLPLAQAQALERAAFALAFQTGHPAEGVTAFLEKRKPRF